MPKAVDINDLLKLSSEERAEIVAALLASLEAEELPPGPTEAELKRRLKDYRENPNQKLLSMDELREALGWKK